MLQRNSLMNEDRNAFYSQYSLKELEIQLMEEKSYQNRNIIRQVIRKKRKDITEEPNNQVVNYNDENIREIEDLKGSLQKTTDFFEQCKIRSSILHLQKNHQKINSQQKTVEYQSIPDVNPRILEARSIINKSLVKKNSTCEEYKQLIYDEMFTTGVDNAILKTGDSVRLIWIMPFKILSSIECTWTFNEQTVTVSHGGGRINVNFDGKQATLVMKNVASNDSGEYEVTIHSQRLKKNCLKFKLVINVGNNDKSASYIMKEEAPSKSEKVTTSTAVPQSEIVYKPVVGLHRNRFNRHKTMIGQEMLGSMNSVVNLKPETVSNNFKEELNNPSPKSAPTVVRRFNRSATSAKDIIQTFCKLNTDEYFQYGVCVENLSTSWTDGLAFCALIHHFHPEAFDFSKLNKANRRENFELAFSSADKYADICPLLDVDDMLLMERPDWKCVFTYVQCFYKTFRTHPKNKLKTVPI